MSCVQATRAQHNCKKRCRAQETFDSCAMLSMCWTCSCPAQSLATADARAALMRFCFKYTVRDGHGLEFSAVHFGSLCCCKGCKSGKGPDPGSQWLSYQMPMRSHTACCSAFYVCGVVIWSPSLSSSVLNTYSEAYLLVATRAPADEA